MVRVSKSTKLLELKTRVFKRGMILEARASLTVAVGCVRVIQTHYIIWSKVASAPKNNVSIIMINVLSSQTKTLFPSQCMKEPELQ